MGGAPTAPPATAGWFAKLIAALTAIGTGARTLAWGVWRDLIWSTYADSVLIKTGKFPPISAFDDLDKIKPSDVSTVLSSTFQQLFGLGFDISGAVFKPITDALLGVHSKELSKLTNVKPGEEAAAASALLDEAIGAGVAAHFAAIAGESFYPTKNLGGPQMAALLAELAGFKEIMKGILGPEMTALVAIPHRYATNARARSALPSGPQATNLFARGVIDAPTRDQLLAWNNLSADYAAAAQAGAYHGYSPRVLLRVIESNLFSTAEIQDELTFSGMRPTSQARMLKAAPYLATTQYRTQLHSAIEQAYLAGLLTDDDVKSNIDAAETDTDRDNLVLLRLHWEQLIASTKALEQAYTTQYIGHVIDLPTFQAQLAGLGLQDWRVNNILATAEARVNAALERQAEAAARLLEKQTIADIRKAALWNFKSGTIDAAGLTAALVATGLTPVQAAAWVDLAELQQGGAVAYLYGQLLNPSQRKILNSEVSAIGEQVIKGVLTPSQAFAQLEALKIPAGDINALVAKWSAEIGAPNAHAQLFNAVTGKPPGA
jgi:hypothetical protein